MPRPRCGNDPRARLTPGDARAIAEFRAYLTRRAQEKTMTEQTLAARDRIAETLARADGWEWAAANFSSLSTPAADRYRRLAEAVLAVLPPPVSGADTPSETVRKRLRRWAYAAGHIESELDDAVNRMYVLVAQDVLRRMADEAQPGTEAHKPRRGDAFEQWLKAQRDEYEQTTGREWRALDEVLDTYRLHADMGVPLGGHVCEARVVGDCECLEQPGTEAPAAPVHACPGLDDNGISPCCKRPPFEFRGERITRDPALVTCPGPAVEAQQDGAQP